MQNVRKNERQQASKRHPSDLANSSDPCAHLSKDTLLASESGRLSIPIVASPSRSSNKLRLQMLSKNIMVSLIIYQNPAFKLNTKIGLIATKYISTQNSISNFM